MTWISIPSVSTDDFIDMPFWRKVWNNLLVLKNKFSEAVSAFVQTSTNITISSATFVDISVTHYRMFFDCSGDRPVLLACGIRWSDSIADNASFGSIQFTVDGVEVTSATNGVGRCTTTVGDSLGEMRIFQWVKTGLSAGTHEFVVQAKQLTGSTGNLIIVASNANPMLWVVEL